MRLSLPKKWKKRFRKECAQAEGFVHNIWLLIVSLIIFTGIVFGLGIKETPVIVVVSVIVGYFLSRAFASISGEPTLKEIYGKLSSLEKNIKNRGQTPDSSIKLTRVNKTDSNIIWSSFSGSLAGSTVMGVIAVLLATQPFTYAEIYTFPAIGSDNFCPQSVYLSSGGLFSVNYVNGGGRNTNLKVYLILDKNILNDKNPITYAIFPNQQPSTFKFYLDLSSLKNNEIIDFNVMADYNSGGFPNTLRPLRDNCKYTVEYGNLALNK